MSFQNSEALAFGDWLFGGVRTWRQSIRGLFKGQEEDSVDEVELPKERLG